MAGEQGTENANDKEQEAFRMDDDGLHEVRNYGKGGGYRLELKGRFGSPRTAIIGKDGKLKISHDPLPEEDDDHDKQKKGREQTDGKGG